MRPKRGQKPNARRFQSLGGPKGRMRAGGKTFAIRAQQATFGTNSPTWLDENGQITSVQEVAHASEEHGQAEPVGGSDDLRIAHRAAWLDHRRGARFRG